MPGMRYQPQGRRQINKANPLTRGLIFLAPMVGGNDLINIATGARATTGSAGTGTNKQGKFASFPAASNVEFPALTNVLGAAQPASIGWVQQPIGANGLHTLAQFAVSGVAFLIFQSPNNSTYYFTAGLRGSSASAFGASTGPLVNGQVDACVLTSTGGFGTNTGLTLFKGGVKHLPSGSGTYSAGTAQPLSIGQREGGADPWRGLIGCFAVWDRVLSDEEARSFNANPWQLFADFEVDDEFLLQAATGSSITVTPASLLLGGGQVAMRVARRVSVAPAALAASGGDVGARAARRLAAAPAALTVSAGTTPLRATRKIGAQPVSMAVSGGDAALLASRHLSVAATTMAAQAGIVQTRASRRLTVAPVAMAVTGGAISFAYTPAPSAGSYVVGVMPAALSLSGGSVNMRVSRRVAVTPAAFALAVGNVRLLAGYRVAASPASLVVAGGPVLLRASHRLQVESAQLVMTGGAGTLRYSQQIEYASAPAGSGYSPQRVEVQARPAQIGGFRPASTQRNIR